MVVMDDGWFGKRDDDNSSLGDWFVNEKKLGGTLVRAHRPECMHQGVKFGIWIEPEMVNEDSDLYRAASGLGNSDSGERFRCARETSLLLRFFQKRSAATVYFDQICAVLDQGKIDYVKWDMNRSMADVYAGNLSYDYVLGVYNFMERLVQPVSGSSA